MDFKAVISNAGEEKLYTSLSNEVARRLPNASVEWKRSYGRPSKNVVLQAHFIKFDSIELNFAVNSASTLTSNPLLHVFWTSCLDNDTYKNRLKNHITQWQSQLKQKEIYDWLIVQVVNQENSKTNKPKIQFARSSVFDKIKTEFGQKLQDRCVQLWEPEKETLFTKSGESWEVLLNQLRNLLLESFGRHLDSFEDQIRVLREKYADPEWPFFKYFIVHEELALIYQSVTLKDDALVQYDEVDALLSQFIINSSGKGYPKWLENLCKKPSSWDGVSLARISADQLKKSIKSGNISLLEFRNYVFSRQVKLLIKMKRKWEIPSRILHYLHATIQELKLLQIEIRPSKIAVWVVLTCMQILQILDSVESNDLQYHALLAQLQDYMRQKLLLLGTITGFFYNRNQTEEESRETAMLLLGFGNNENSKKEASSVVCVLKDAFSCSLNYKKFYLDTSIRCMELFYDIKRNHFGMLVAMDIANFYLEQENYIEAEPLLEKAWNVYKEQKWEKLYTNVLIPLADCQYKHQVHDRYLNSVTLLACAHCLPQKTREHYSKELLKLSQASNNLPITEISPILEVTNLKVNLVKNKGHVGDTVVFSLTLNNNLVANLTCNLISIYLKHRDLNDPDSFIDPVNSSHKSLFDPTDYGMNITLSPIDKPKETAATKEALTPSNLLKRLKTHRRTFSRNKNTLEESKIESQNDANDSVFEKSRKELLHKSFSAEDISTPEKKQIRKALFESTLSLPNGELKNKTKSEKRSSLLEIVKSKETIDDMKDKSSLDENQWTSSIKSNDSSLSEPIATSSVSNNVKENTKQNGIADESCSDTSILNSTVFTDRNERDLTVSGKDFVLTPGKNTVQLANKIIIEGRYIFHCLSCSIGNVQLKSKLNLQHGSFFIVADPPKIAWTTSYVSDCLLSGKKQRLHITLLNGPGYIKEGSILKITSKSGLQFFSLNHCAIEIYPLVRDGLAREAFLSVTTAEVDNGLSEAFLALPACEPFERVNVYYDVLAPIKRKLETESAMTQHEMNFSCVWLDELLDTSMRLDCIFYEPFKVEHHVFIRNQRAFIKITVHGINPVQLSLASPQLTLLKNPENLVLTKVTKNENLNLYGNEEFSLLWFVNTAEVHGRELECQFQLNFTSRTNDKSDQGTFAERFKVQLKQGLFKLSVLLDEKTLVKGELYSFNICITRNIKQTLDYSLYLTTDPTENTWSNTETNQMKKVEFLGDTDKCEVQIQLRSDCVGYITLPKFILCKLYDVENSDDDNQHMEDMKNFEPGEVEYESIATVMCIDEKERKISGIETPV